MRKTLLGRVEGTCITCAKFEKVMHQYSTILSIQELVHDILINLKKIVFKSNSNSCKTKKKKYIYFWTQIYRWLLLYRCCIYTYPKCQL
jgi:DNA-directed RNA polymerase alpha subunit